MLKNRLESRNQEPGDNLVDSVQTGNWAEVRDLCGPWKLGYKRENRRVCRGRQESRREEVSY